MSLISQTTLAGLPNEMIGMIMANAMAKSAPIDTRPLSDGEPHPLATDEDQALKPFNGNSTLQKIAREEYWENNTFLSSIEPDPNDSSQRGMVFLDDPAEREKIKHLMVEMPTIHPVDHGLPLIMPGDAVAVAEVAVLTRIPGLYPNLRSMTVNIVNKTSDDWPDPEHVSFDFFFDFLMRDQQRSDRQAISFITSVAQALRTLSSPTLESKNITFEHSIFSKAADAYHAPFGMQAIEMSSEMDDLALHVLDMPKAIVRFPDNRRSA
ncbi:hypothetical protein LTR85_007463 [Meristemomyces frigidus]|nr:hypothetical protein LTR85_007463 [Meristemomyces frigidus]